MLEFIGVMLLIVALGIIFLMLASIFMAYVTQATYLDPFNDEGDELND
jgi:uncharacterized membrane protein